MKKIVVFSLLVGSLAVVLAVLLSLIIAMMTANTDIAWAVYIVSPAPFIGLLYILFAPKFFGTKDQGSNHEGGDIGEVTVGILRDGQGGIVGE